MKGNEERCARAFHGVLRRSGMESMWVPVANDPPDLLFTVEAQRWAVEVTELHQYMTLPERSEPESRHAFERPIERLCERIQKKAKFGAQRTYLIDFRGPIDRATSEIVEHRALEFMARGETGHRFLDAEPIAHPDPVARHFLKMEVEGRARVRIEAFRGPAKVICIYGPDGDVLGGDGEHFSSDIQATITHSMDRMLGDKLPKLRRLTGYDRRVLLLWREYPFATALTLASELASRDLEGVDAVLLVSSAEISSAADPGGVLDKCCPFTWLAKDLEDPW